MQAQTEHAAAELKELDQKAELVKLSDTSRAFRLVAERIEPCVVHIDTEQITRAGGNNVFDEFFGIPAASIARSARDRASLSIRPVTSSPITT